MEKKTFNSDDLNFNLAVFANYGGPCTQAGQQATFKSLQKFPDDVPLRTREVLKSHPGTYFVSPKGVIGYNGTTPVQFCPLTTQGVDTLRKALKTSCEVVAPRVRSKK